MDLALYHPEQGYYRRASPRIGYEPGTDFYTASTSAPVFGALVIAAIETLLGGRRASQYHFVEVGAEPGRGILSTLNHPFASSSAFGPAETPRLSGSCIVFSNELFDAQPFRRFVKRTEGWREIYVELDSDRALLEYESDENLPDLLPAAAPDGYRLDAPLAARELAEQLASAEWSGLFVAFDYGKSWQQLIQSTPEGTARAYHHHTQSNDLLARPGQQDLTCHICWDWLESSLTRNGFSAVSLESQEAFFVRHASQKIQTFMTEDAAISSPRKRSLMQLLHPAYLGQKFEVLHGYREGSQNCP